MNKKISPFIFFILFFWVTPLFSQDHISLSLHQDLKLAFFDDEKGNSAGTLDLITKLKYQATQRKAGYFVYFLELERAAILNGYTRFGGAIGFTFNQLFNDADFEITPNAGFGTIFRNDNSFPSWSASVNTAYKVTNTIKVGLLFQFINRSDLKDKDTRFSLFAGIEINLFQTY